jgi:hypothetical protein
VHFIILGECAGREVTAFDAFIPWQALLVASRCYNQAVIQHNLLSCLDVQQHLLRSFPLSSA